MRQFLGLSMVLLVLLLGGCKSDENRPGDRALADEVKQHCKTHWQIYKDKAWGHDECRFTTGDVMDYYPDPMALTLFNAYSTLRIMGLEEEAEESENYILDSVNLKPDFFVQSQGASIFILGGLLSIYELNPDPKVLLKTEAFGRQLLPAFDSPTGLPRARINLATGETLGDTITLAQAGGWALEMGILSYYTNDPVFYTKAKRAMLYLYNNLGKTGLTGLKINVQNGEWITEESALTAESVTFYETALKCWKLFGDTDMLHIWKNCRAAAQKHLATAENNRHWYKSSNMLDGTTMAAIADLSSTRFDAMLAYDEQIEQAEKSMQSWDQLWREQKSIVSIYNFMGQEIIETTSDLDASMIAANFYFYGLSSDKVYMENCKSYWQLYDLIEFPSSQWLGEFSKYFYLTFQYPSKYNLRSSVFSTAGHPFEIGNFKEFRINEALGI